MRKIKLALALIIFLMLLHPAGARDEEGMRVVPAQEILDKIERGEPVKYDHVIVEGDLDLGKVKLPKWEEIHDDFDSGIGSSRTVYIVSSSIRIFDTIINGEMSFYNAIFISPVSFSYSDVNGDAYFGGSAFNGGAYFRNMTFNGDANFRGSEFNSDAYFMRSAFNRNAYFERSAFKGAADFAISEFKRTADFSESTFNGSAVFDFSVFKGKAEFGDSIFNDHAGFWSSNFSSEAYFGYSAFNADTNFFNARFGGPVMFSSTEFNKKISFDDASFDNSTSFNRSRFKEDPFFEGALFDGTLYLTHAKYDRLYVRWNSIRELGYDDAAYLALLENFKKLGYVEDYDACYYEYRRLHRDQPWSGRYHAMHPAEEWLRKRIDLGLQAFYGYGKKPIWPLLWSAGTILLFGLIWRRAGVDGSKSRGSIFERFAPSGEKKQKQSQKEQLRALGGAMLFSATLFLSGTRLFVDPPAMPKLEGWLAAHARSVFIAERVLGAFFSILFFLAVSGTVVR